MAGLGSVSLFRCCLVAIFHAETALTPAECSADSKANRARSLS